MSTTQNPRSGTLDPDDPRDDQVSPTPNEDGPHDVSDDKVIEETLPTTPPSDSGGSGQP